jgi:hypothetical protein
VIRGRPVTSFGSGPQAVTTEVRKRMLIGAASPDGDVAEGEADGGCAGLEGPIPEVEG